MDVFSRWWIDSYFTKSIIFLLIACARLPIDLILRKFIFKNYQNIRKVSDAALVSLVLSAVFLVGHMFTFAVTMDKGVIFGFQFLMQFAYLLSTFSYMAFILSVMMRICVRKFPKFGSFDFCDALTRSFRAIKSINRQVVSFLWAVVIFLLFYMMGFFGVAESYYGNVREWHFDFSDLLQPMGIVFLVCIGLIVLGIFVFSRFKWFSIFTCLLAVTVVSSYFQDLLPKDSNLINGSAHFTISDCFAHVVCAFILIIFVGSFLFVCIRHRDLCTKVLSGSLIAMFVMLLIPTIVIFASIGDVDKDTNRYILSGEDQYKVSGEKNVVVFVMDSFSQNYMDKFSDTVANFAKNTNFRDFVNYSDVGSNFCSTAAAMPSVLTGMDADMSVKTIDRNAELWKNDGAEYFYKKLHDEGFVVNLYTDTIEYCGDGENMKGKIDNLDQIDLEYKVDSMPVYLKMMQLSAYKYSLKLLNGYFYISGSDAINKYCNEVHGYNYDATNFGNVNVNTDLNKRIDHYNKDFYESLSDKGLTVTNDEGRFNVIHLVGMHVPFLNIEGESDSQERVFEDCFTLIDAYCDELKRCGVYDDALIIVTADHGDDFSHSGMFDDDMSGSHCVFMIKTPNMSNQFLRKDMSKGYLPTDLLPTILDGMSCNYDEDLFTGRSLLSMNESEPRHRSHYALVYSQDHDPVFKCVGFSYSVYNGYIQKEYDSIDELLHVDPDSLPFNPIADYWW